MTEGEFLSTLWESFKRSIYIRQPGGEYDCGFCYQNRDEGHEKGCKYLVIEGEAKKRGIA